MEFTNKQSQSKELLRKIIYKAWEDEIFKQELIANPIEAIERATGERVKLPNNKTIVVRDQTDVSIIYINIPAQPNMDDVELTDEQLEIIVGGGGPLPGVVLQNTEDPS